jgi:hypothetical protein
MGMSSRMFVGISFRKVAKEEIALIIRSEINEISKINAQKDGSLTYWHGIKHDVYVNKADMVIFDRIEHKARVIWQESESESLNQDLSRTCSQQLYTQLISHVIYNY